ncbi:MAG: ATP-dependent helicase HrpB, partial [Myxococcota bacterium]|nr:ATP-dependent helicase HrpB [Myxococcota bacterium]
MPLAEPDLPVAAVLGALRDALHDHGRVVLQAPPGAGKTTLVPPALLDQGWPGEIVLLQPRRVAARAVARMLCRRVGGALGETVGYQIRFDKRVSATTRLRVVTEGVLTAWLQRDPELTGVAAVVLDEYHERSLQADLSLAWLKEVQEALRPDLKLVVMSATLDAEPIAAFLGGCPTVRCEGRQHPLEVTYEARASDGPIVGQLTKAVRGLLDEMQAGTAPPGHVLAFLPGVREIDEAVSALRSRGLDREVLPLHGRLDARAQDRVLEPSPSARIIVSTNVAETSLTVPGVTAVVDSGLVRIPRHDPGLGAERLELCKISRASADQRAGRAGRLGAGRAHRLWTAHEHRSRPAFDAPEIRRADLAPLVLALRTWGVTDLAGFEFFERPDPASLVRAEALLADLGALSPDGALTDIGRQLQGLPAAPRVGRFLLAARERGLLGQAAWVAAVLTERHGARVSGVGAADAVAALRGLSSRPGAPELKRIARVAAQLARTLGEDAAPVRVDWDDDGLCEALLHGWPDRLCRRADPAVADLSMVGGRGARLDSRSVVQGDELLLALELDAGRRGERARSLVRSAARVDPAWIDGHRDVHEAEVVRWDAERQRVVAARERCFRDLVLSSRSVPLTDRLRAAACLAEAAAREPERALAPCERAQAMLNRMSMVAKIAPDAGLPEEPWGWLVSRLPVLCEGRASFDELRQLDLAAAIQDGLAWPQRRALDELAPTHVSVPSGRRAALDYPAEGDPVLAIKVQEVFGWTRTPMVCGGRQPVVLHLLNPAGRPLQVTRDLESFWDRTWIQVRKEMRSRYPKHRWPEDPRGAEPSQHTTKKRRR